MSFAQHDHVAQTLSAYRTDCPFAIGILPGRTWRGWDFFDSHALGPILEVVAVDAVSIAYEKTRRFFVREGVDDLLGTPFSVGIGCDVEMVIQ